MKVIGMALMEATAMGLGLDLEGEEWATLKANVEDSFWCVLPESGPTFASIHSNKHRVMRSIAYPPLPTDAPGISCGEHKDYGCWTLREFFSLFPSEESR